MKQLTGKIRRAITLILIKIAIRTTENGLTLDHLEMAEIMERVEE